MTDADWPPWYERVATRLPFWRNEGLLLFPLGIIAVVAANASSIESGVDLLGWALAALVGAALSVLFIGLFPLPFTRGETPRLGATAVIAAAAGTGAIFALGVSITARVLGLPDPDPLWWRVLGSAIIIGWFAIVLTLALDARSRLRRQGDHLVDEAIALESARLSTSAIGEEMHRAVTEEVETALTTARESLGDRTTDAAAAAEFARWPQIAAELRATQPRQCDPSAASSGIQHPVISIDHVLGPFSPTSSTGSLYGPWQPRRSTPWVRSPLSFSRQRALPRSPER